MEFKEILRKYRKEHGLTQTELAAKLGYRDIYIHMIEKGIRKGGKEFLKKFAQLSGYSIDELLGHKTTTLPTVPLKRVPLFAGAIPAGYPKDVPESYVEDWVDCPDKAAEFAVKIDGDSMIDKNIHNGDIVFCKRQSSADNGDIVVARLDHGEEYTVKTLKKLKDRILLLPANDKYEPIMLKKVDIIGIVIGVFHKIRKK